MTEILSRADLSNLISEDLDVNGQKIVASVVLNGDFSNEVIMRIMGTPDTEAAKVDFALEVARLHLGVSSVK